MLRPWILAVLVSMPVFALAADYQIDRHSDGPFTFTISGVQINEGSTLERENILFNDPQCPVEVISHTTKITYKDRGFRFSSRTSVKIANPIVALEVRTGLYDIFGQHMHNLGNTEVRDFGDSQFTIEGEWRASENDVADLLTTVTFVSRARFVDGSQWVFDADNLQLALLTLALEQTIGDGDEKKQRS